MDFCDLPTEMRRLIIYHTEPYYRIRWTLVNKECRDNTLVWFRDFMSSSIVYESPYGSLKRCDVLYLSRTRYVSASTYSRLVTLYKYAAKNKYIDLLHLLISKFHWGNIISLHTGRYLRGESFVEIFQSLYKKFGQVIIINILYGLCEGCNSETDIKNIERLYTLRKKEEHKYNYIIPSVRSGYLPLVKFWVNVTSPMDIWQGFIEACRGGDLEMVKYFLSLLPHDEYYISQGIREANKGGYTEIINIITMHKFANMIKEQCIKIEYNSDFESVDEESDEE